MRKSFYISFGIELKKKREAAGLTVADLARLSGEQYTTISNIEAGKAFQMHHFVWMENIFGGISETIKGIKYDKEAIKKESIKKIREESNEESFYGLI